MWGSIDLVFVWVDEMDLVSCRVIVIDIDFVLECSTSLSHEV